MLVVLESMGDLCNHYLTLGSKVDVQVVIGGSWYLILVSCALDDYALKPVCDPLFHSFDTVKLIFTNYLQLHQPKYIHYLTCSQNHWTYDLAIFPYYASLINNYKSFRWLDLNRGQATNLTNLLPSRVIAPPMQMWLREFFLRYSMKRRK